MRTLRFAAGWAAVTVCVAAIVVAMTARSAIAWLYQREVELWGAG